MSWASMLTAGLRSRVAYGAGVGAIAGALYGAVSSDTSIVGGAMQGAGLGAIAGIGARRAYYGYRGIGVNAPGLRGVVSGFGRGISSVGRQGIRVAGNKAFNPIRGITPVL